MTDSIHDLIAKDAQTIEETLEGFGIKAKVMTVDTEAQSNLFCVDIAQGVRVEEIEALSRTLAMRLASHTGNVEVTVPLPGQALIGIRVPKLPEKTPNRRASLALSEPA